MEKNESEFSSVLQQDFIRLWQRNGYMDRRRENGNKREEEEGEMVKWIQ